MIGADLEIIPKGIIRGEGTAIKNPLFKGLEYAEESGDGMVSMSIMGTNFDSIKGNFIKSHSTKRI